MTVSSSDLLAILSHLNLFLSTLLSLGGLVALALFISILLRINRILKEVPAQYSRVTDLLLDNLKQLHRTLSKAETVLCGRIFSLLINAVIRWLTQKPPP